MLEIYVDGSAINNENPNKPTLGGVGVAMIEDGNVTGVRVEVSNHTLKDFPLDLKQTTNNTTELAAIYVALELIKGKAGEYTIYGDSQYAGNLVFGNWKPKENKELVAKVKQLASEVPNVTWEYVKAHADNQYNNYADYLARSGAYKTPETEVLSFNEWLLTA
jgi:ribonuclease HI